MKQIIRKHLKRRLNSDGYSLIEIMMAMTFLAIGLLAVGQMVPAGLVGMTQARVRTNAVQAAQQRLDNLRSSSYSSAALAAGTYSETIGDYTINWTITNNSPVPGSKRVDLTASWNTIKGTQSSNLTTYVSAR